MLRFDEMIGTEVARTSKFDLAAGLVEDHDPADGSKLRDLHAKAVAGVAAHQKAKTMEECAKHCAAIDAALSAMKPVIERL